jgi:carotenoid cleavage dioxygenase
MIAFRYAFEKPFLTWSTIGRDGSVTRADQPIDVDAAYMIHDCAITRSYLVLFVCPAPFDLTSQDVLRWAPERGTRIALVPRDGSAVTWVTADAFWVWHFVNAFEEVDANGATTVVVDYPAWSALAMGPSTATGHIARARIDPAQRRATFEHDRRAHGGVPACRRSPHRHAAPLFLLRRQGRGDRPRRLRPHPPLRYFHG